MSQPPSPYDRQYNFTDFQSANPTTPLPGQKVDQELNAVRSTLNATVSRLGEVQADDGKVRNSALNLTTIAEAVEPLLTTAPVQAVNAAGAAQVAAVNATGTTQISAVNAAAASGVAQINAATTTPIATTILGAEQSAVAAASTAQTSAANSLINKNLAYTHYVNAGIAANEAQLASGIAEGYAINAEDSRTAAATEANNAQNAADLANGYKNDANESKMAALQAKADAEAAANIAQSIVDDGAAAITAEVQPYLDAAAQSATDAHNSANDALTSKTQAATSATNASNSASSAATSASNASSSASSAAASATAAANSAAAINPAAYAPAVHTHAIADVTGLQTALDGKTAVGHTHPVGDITGLASALTGYATLAANTFTGKQTTPASTASAAGFNLPHGAGPSSPVNGDLWSTTGGLFARIAGFTYPIATTSYVLSQGYLTASAAYSTFPTLSNNGIQAAINANKTDYSTTPSTYLTGGDTSNGYNYGLLMSLSSPSYSGWTVNFIADTYYTYQSPSTNTLDVYYNQYDDVSAIKSNLEMLGIPGYSFAYNDDGMGPYYSSLNTSVTLVYQTIGVQGGDRFVFDLEARMVEQAKAAGTSANHVLYFDGSISMAWGRPWTNEGYAYGYQLSSYAGLYNQNTFTQRQAFPASTSSNASIRMPHGTAPSSPVNGDVWTTTTGAFTRVNGFTANMSVCRAWVNFNGTGTVSIRSTFNVSSITDNGVGDYTINFGAAMPDVNYSPQISSNWVIGSNGAWAGGLCQHPTVAPTTSALRLQQTAMASDFTYCNVAIFR